MPSHEIRVPPQAVDVEKSVLGAMLINQHATAEALGILNEDSFYMSNHRMIFTAMEEMFAHDEAIDVVTVVERLRRNGRLEACGGEAYLSELVGCVATAANIPYYADILQDMAARRGLISASADITTDAFDLESSRHDLLDQAESRIFAVSDKHISQGCERLGGLLRKTFENIEVYFKGGFRGVPSGFRDLDDLTSGFQNGDLIVLAARPSMGKTALALTIALNAAVRAKKSVAIFSFEMPKTQLAERMLCAEGRVNMHSLRKGTLPKNQLAGLSNAAGPLSDAEIYIDDSSRNVYEIRAKARRLKRSGTLDLIIVDYLQLITMPTRSENRQQEVSEISRSLKGIARDLEVPLIALSQLTRAVELRQDKRPMLSDLRESGAIEQDSDLVMFIYRPGYYSREEEEDGGEAEIILAKHRNGPTGLVKLAFVKKFARFENLAEGGF